MRKSFILALLLSACSCWSQTVLDRANKDELVFMQSEEPAMAKAFLKARESLDAFLAKATSASPDHIAFSLKVAVSQGPNTEYFWVNRFTARPDGMFEGEIANEPRMVMTVKLGQRYNFSRNEIVDWTYIDKVERRMIGNFTLCALLTKESAQEAEATKKRFKLDCAWLQ